MTTVAVTIRKGLATEARDVNSCLEAAFEPFRSEYTSGAYEDTVPGVDAIRNRMRHMTVYVAVSDDGEIAGTVACAIDGEEGHLRGMAIRPAWQGRGVAEQLLNRVENDLLELGCVQITLDTTDPLTRAERFYRRNGFVPSGTVRDFFGMPLREHVKPLTGRSSRTRAMG